jgi:hypothetical protein
MDVLFFAFRLFEQTVCFTEFQLQQDKHSVGQTIVVQWIQLRGATRNFQAASSAEPVDAPVDCKPGSQLLLLAASRSCRKGMHGQKCFTSATRSLRRELAIDIKQSIRGGRLDRSSAMIRRYDVAYGGGVFILTILLN